MPPYLALVDMYVRLGHADLALQVVKSGLRALPGSPELLDRLARLEGTAHLEELCGSCWR